MPKYFRYFPQVQHSNFQVRDITKRVRFTERVRNEPFVFLPYTVQEGDRPEDVSYLYYGTVNRVWMIYVANNIIDPYSDWPMDQYRLDRYIEDKYLYSCAQCALNRVQLFDDIKVQFAILVDAVDKNVQAHNIPFYTDRYHELLQYIQLNRDSYYLRSVLSNFRRLLEDNSYTYDVRNVTAENINQIRNLSSNFTTDVLQTGLDGNSIETPSEITELIVHVPSKEKLQAQFDVLSWTKLEDDTVRNVVHYENVDDSEYRISVDTYNLNIGSNPLDPTFDPTQWRPVRFYDYEFMQNENRRQIYLVDRDYADQVERELKSVLK